MGVLETAIRAALAKHGMSVNRLAVLAGITEPTLYSIMNRDDAKVSQLRNLAKVLEVSESYFFQEEPEASSDTSQSGTGNIQQAGSHNKQKIMPGAESTGHTASDTNTEDLTSKLSQCEQEKSSLARELDVTRELVRAKDEMILLLKGSRNNQN